MPPELPRVVFDCNIYFQALISPLGPSARCLIAAARGQVLLFCSESSVLEIRDVAGRPALRQKFAITEERLEQFIEAIRECAIFISEIADVYRHPFDPDDSHYINLAISCNARLLASRDRDLLLLMDTTRPEGRDFRERFPLVEILSRSAAS